MKENQNETLVLQRFRLGVLAGDAVIDVTDIVSDIPHIDRGDIINGLIERFEDYRGKLESAVANGDGMQLTGSPYPPTGPKADHN